MEAIGAEDSTSLLGYSSGKFLYSRFNQFPDLNNPVHKWCETLHGTSGQILVSSMRSGVHLVHNRVAT